MVVISNLVFENSECAAKEKRHLKGVRKEGDEVCEARDDRVALTRWNLGDADGLVGPKATGSGAIPVTDGVCSAIWKGV
jgi:hypothetical protein